MKLQSPKTGCPLCGGCELHAGFSIRQVPAHTVVLHHTAREAIAQPRGDIDLMCCYGCGFIFNAAFDPGLHHYQTGYEATQSFSATFSDFDRAMATEIADTIGNREGSVIEVGCGQGEFLALLAETGVRELIGFDPAFDPDRSAVGGNKAITIFDTIFDETAVHDMPGAVICKMTLEHMANPIGMLAEIAKLASRQPDCDVFIQVPNGLDVMARKAFWDVYYEHCNYFTANTLTLAMHRAGLDVLEMKPVFSAQYLVARGQPARKPADEHCASPNAQGTLERFQQFSNDAQQAISFWQKRCTGMLKEGRRLALWGAGSKAIAFLEATRLVDAFTAAIDVNPRKDGTYLAGSALPVLDPSRASDIALTDVVLMNANYETEVGATLKELHIPARLHLLDGQMSNSSILSTALRNSSDHLLDSMRK